MEKIKVPVNKLKEALMENAEKAKDYLDDNEKMEKLFRDFEKKLKLVPGIGDKLSDIAVMASMIRMYIKKEYTEVSQATILLSIAALIYVVNPLDLVPDTIPVLGLVDDAAAIAMVLVMVESDLNQYKKWQKENGIR